MLASCWIIVLVDLQREKQHTSIFPQQEGKEVKGRHGTKWMKDENFLK